MSHETITVTVSLPDHPSWTVQEVIEIPSTGLGPRALDKLYKKQLLLARDALVRKSEREAPK